MGFKWVCPDCKARYAADAGKPLECPECGFLGPTDKGEVVMPFLSKAKHRSPDAIYRAEEQGSKFRAEMAAAQLGVPVSDMSAMLVTDQRDGLREGDTSAPKIDPNNQVAKAMQAPMPAGQVPIVGQASQVAGQYFSSAVPTGPVPNAGAHVQRLLRSEHTRNADPRMQGRVTSENPALETASPYYRPRV